MNKRDIIDGIKERVFYKAQEGSISIETFELIKELAEMHCSKSEIARLIGLTTKEFEDLILSDINAAAAIEYGDAFGKMSIRRQQQVIMNSGSSDMAKFLGKQYLGQSDKIEQKTEFNTSDDGGIVLNFITPVAVKDETGSTE